MSRTKYSALKTIRFTLLFCFITACTSTYQVSTPEQLQKSIGSSGGVIVFGNGARRQAAQISIDRDSTIFQEEKSSARRGVATSEITSIQQTSHFSGAIGGLSLGIVAGGFAGGCTGFLSYDRSSETGSKLIVTDLMIGAAVGAVAGLIYGVIHGDRTVYEYKPDSTKIKLPPIFN